AIVSAVRETQIRGSRGPGCICALCQTSSHLWLLALVLLRRRQSDEDRMVCPGRKAPPGTHPIRTYARFGRKSLTGMVGSDLPFYFPDVRWGGCGEQSETKQPEARHSITG